MVTLLGRDLNQYEQAVLKEYFKRRSGRRIPYHLIQGGRADRMYEIRSVDTFVSYEKDTHSMLIESYAGNGSREEKVVAEWGAHATGNDFEKIEKSVTERVTSFVRYDVDDLASVIGIFGGGFAMMICLILIASAFPGWKEAAAGSPFATFIGVALLLATLSAVVFFGGFTFIRHLFNAFALNKKLSRHPVLQLIRTRSHTNTLGLEKGVPV